MLFSVVLGGSVGGKKAAMNAWVGRMPWAVGWTFWAATLLAASPSIEQLRGWVRQLDADEFSVREEAGRNLTAAGAASIEPLAAAIASSSPEAAWRATAMLEQIALGSDEATTARACAAIHRLSQGSPGVAGVLKEITIKKAKQRRDKAVAKIRALGGKFGTDEQSAAFFPAAAPLEALEVLRAIDVLAVEPAAEAVPLPAAKPAAEPSPPPDAPPPETAPPDPAFAAPAIGDAFVGGALAAVEELPVEADEELTQSVTIDRAWRGGDRGLATLRDLPSILSLSLHNAPLTDAALAHIAALPKLQSLDIQSTPFTTAGLLKFREQRPEVRIFARGSAMLGVSAEPSGPCVLNSVFDGSGAAEAGLKVGDEITAIGDQKVRDFSDLTIAVFSHQAGDKLAITFNRDQQSQAAAVILKERQTP